MQDQKFRDKITWFSFIFTLLVVWVHSANAELFLGSSESAAVVEDAERFLSEAIGQIAVPGFFMISGYLFFRGFELNKLWGKWERRIRSMLMPYILWNLLYYLGYVLASRIPFLSSVVGKGTISFNLEELITAILRFKYNPVFWYMFQLILLVILAPVIWLFIRSFRGRILLFAVLSVLLIFDIYLPFLNTDALLYFSLAGSLALNKKTKALCEAEKRTTLSIFLSLLALLAAVGFYWLGLNLFIPVCFVICRILAVGGLWFFIPAAVLPRPGWVVTEHFFLYATHFALVRLINKTIDMILPAAFHVAVVPLIIFFAMPFVTLAASSALYSFLHRHFPKICLILNGGRQ